MNKTAHGNVLSNVGFYFHFLSCISQPTRSLHQSVLILSWYTSFVCKSKSCHWDILERDTIVIQIRNRLICISCFDSWLSQSTTIQTVLRLKSNCLFHTHMSVSPSSLFLLHHSLVAPFRHTCMSSYIPSLRLLHSCLFFIS